MESDDTWIGLFDAITTLTEIFLRLGIDPEVLAQPLEFQRDAQRHAGRPNAAAVLDALVDYARDPERQKQRQAIQLLKNAPPKGTA